MVQFTFKLNNIKSATIYRFTDDRRDVLYQCQKLRNFNCCIKTRKYNLPSQCFGFKKNNSLYHFLNANDKSNLHEVKLKVRRHSSGLFNNISNQKNNLYIFKLLHIF